jgi:phosphonoacetate hydrolase
MGAVVAITADHGMNDKSKPDGTPNVIYLQDILDRHFGAGDTKVICPITDAFVRHHGALGGFVRVWCRGGRATPQQIIDVVRSIPGVMLALDKQQACERFELPPDREGDVAVLGDIHTVIGASEAEHDLSTLADARLRSHGSTTEARVPFILNRPIRAEYRARAAAGLKSHRIFEYALNAVEVAQ